MIEYALFFVRSLLWRIGWCLGDQIAASSVLIGELCCCQLVIVGLLLLETLSSVKWTNPGFLFASLLSFSKLTSCMQLVTVGLISMIYNTADAFGHPQASNQSINSFKCDINPIAHMDAILARKKR